MNIKGKYTLQDFEDYNSCEKVPFELEKYKLISTAEDLIETVELQKIYDYKLSYKFYKKGVDTEQSFAQTYEAFLCLIQISTEEQDYIIDLLSINDKHLIKSEIEKIFLDKDIIKIFYAGQTDIVWLQRDYNIFISNYFDVQLAATFLNKDEDWSLTYLLQKYCDYKLEKDKKKQLQLSEWSNRPLSDEQLNYAALDSHYLIKLRYEILYEMIQELDYHRTLEFLRKMQKTTQKKYEKKLFDEFYYFSQFEKLSKEQITKIGSSIKNTSQWKILHHIFIELAKLRENFSAQNNKFIYRVMTDQSLLDLSYSSFDDQTFEFNNQDKIKNIENYVDKYSKEFLETYSAQILNVLNSYEINQEEIFKRYDELCIPIKNKMMILQQKIDKKTKTYQERYSMKTVPYENCQILSPEGKQLCNCNNKKINWYLKKNLATLVSKNPTIIKLNFKPSGKVKFDADEQEIFENNYFYVTERENQCVVCGSTEQFSKFYVIPSLYRRHFPEIYFENKQYNLVKRSQKFNKIHFFNINMKKYSIILYKTSLKSHRSQDILVLCMNCHKMAGNYSDKLIDDICKQYQVDKIKLETASLYKDVIQKLSKSSGSYEKNKANMPKENRQKIKLIIRQNYKDFLNLKDIEQKIELKPSSQFSYNQKGEIKITSEFLQYCKSLDYHKNIGKENSSNDFKNQHGRLVVEQFKNLQEITDFVLMWRQNFIKTMKPKFLPKDWKEKPLRVQKQDEQINQQNNNIIQN